MGIWRARAGISFLHHVNECTSPQTAFVEGPRTSSDCRSRLGGTPEAVAFCGGLSHLLSLLLLFLTLRPILHPHPMDTHLTSKTMSVTHNAAAFAAPPDTSTASSSAPSVDPSKPAYSGDSSTDTRPRNHMRSEVLLDASPTSVWVGVAGNGIERKSEPVWNSADQEGAVVRGQFLRCYIPSVPSVQRRSPAGGHRAGSVRAQGTCADPSRSEIPQDLDDLRVVFPDAVQIGRAHV